MCQNQGNPCGSQSYSVQLGGIVIIIQEQYGCVIRRKRLSKSGRGEMSVFLYSNPVADATVCRHHGGPIESPPRTSRHYGTEGFKENLHLRPHYTERQHQMRKILPVRTFPCRRESPDVILPNCLQIQKRFEISFKVGDVICVPGLFFCIRLAFYLI